ncbi:PAAR-like protein [Danxiaibacter flavus]|uniref:PAAR-like protein n=1 Tax=Danxiaibacter flavus TaxID=3049108 RepID=A0ABV3ZGY3_9BACT|nr:PAAR-like protein [Chitinophagaceae bacterium DXS]
MGLLSRLLSEPQVTDRQHQELAKSAKQILKSVETTPQDEGDPISTAAFQSAANNARQKVAEATDTGPAPDSKEARKEKKKENEWHDPNEQIKYVNEQGKVSCTFCSCLIGDIKVTSTEVKLQDALWATAGDKNDAANIQFKGVCNHSKWGRYKPPCSGVIQLGEWKNLSNTIIDSHPALLRKSAIPCNISGQDIKIEHSGQRAVLEELPDDYRDLEADNDTDDPAKPPTCNNCSSEFTIEQVKAMAGTLTSQQEKFAISVLKYLNLYRAKFNLDTCIRKAQFMAQVMAETDAFSISLESGNYQPSALTEFAHGGTRFHKDALLADYFIEPEKDQKKCYGYFSDVELDTKIILEYKSTSLIKDKKILRELLKEEPYNQIKIDQRELYGRSMKDTKTKQFIDKTLYDDKDLKIILKGHEAYQVEIFSRAYGGWMKNGDEKTKDGYRFRGRGILQLTGREDYTKLSEYRNKHPFPSDASGDIDFTKDVDAASFKGNYEKLDDKEDAIYAVQSAVWEWFDSKKTSLFGTNGFADNDDIAKVSKTINGGFNGIKRRNDYIKKARQKTAFDVFNHYETVYNNGNTIDKKIVMKNLQLLNKDASMPDPDDKTKNIKFKDDNAIALYEKLRNQEEEAKKTDTKKI